MFNSHKSAFFILHPFNFHTDVIGSDFNHHSQTAGTAWKELSGLKIETDKAYQTNFHTPPPPETKGENHIPISLCEPAFHTTLSTLNECSALNVLFIAIVILCLLQTFICGFSVGF